MTAGRAITRLLSIAVLAVAVSGCAAIRDWLVQIGAMNPDGTPAVPPGAPRPPAPGVVAPGQPAAEPGKLWTPGGQQAAGEKPKLWTPGMD